MFQPVLRPTATLSLSSKDSWFPGDFRDFERGCFKIALGEGFGSDAIIARADLQALAVKQAQSTQKTK
jgi:hypothetical protein